MLSGNVFRQNKKYCYFARIAIIMQVNVFGLGTNFLQKRRDLGQTRQEKIVSYFFIREEKT